MNRFLKIFSVFLVLLSFIGCNTKNKQSAESSLEVHNIYVETSNNFSPELKSCFVDKLFSREDTLWSPLDSAYIVYRYKDMGILPTENLLDNTRKMRVSISDKKDTIGNPSFNVELFVSEQSKWKRISNIGDTPIYNADTTWNFDQLCNLLVNAASISNSKMLSF